MVNIIHKPQLLTTKLINSKSFLLTAKIFNKTPQQSEWKKIYPCFSASVYLDDKALVLSLTYGASLKYYFFMGVAKSAKMQPLHASKVCS